VTYSWLLLYGKYPDHKKAQALKDFVTWSVSDGQKFAEGLGFISLPPHISEVAIKAISEIQ
jgi:phosphate transport system substrate-binding protein